MTLLAETASSATAVANGIGRERKGRSDKMDGVAAARERAPKTVVGGRRRARRIDDCHTHCGDDTSVSALARNTAAARAKHALDRVLAAIGLVVFSPVLAAIALWILFETGRPVLFAHPRVGKDERVFR